MDETRMNFLGRMRQQFQRPAQTLQEFANEIKQLTPEDKAWLVERFNAEGMPTDPPKTA